MSHQTLLIKSGLFQHYHSMEVFSHFEILDLKGNRVVEGHKVMIIVLEYLKIIDKNHCQCQLQASFCLEDNDCDSGIEEKYKCENFGDQVFI